MNYLFFKEKNMRSLLYLLLTLLCLASCKEAEELHYNHAASVYFDFDPNRDDRDSVVSTFAEHPNQLQDTILLPIRISGVRVPYARQFQAYVEQDSSTAVPNQHYEPLKDSYTIDANAGGADLPIFIYNTDSALEERSVSLIIKLQASDALAIGIPSLIRAKVVFSNKLEKPAWWDSWMPEYYSRVKHELFILVTGLTELTTDGQDAPKNLYFVSLLTVMLNDPFAWVAKNPDKGYILEPVEAGQTDRYYFYNPTNPARKTLLRKNADTGKYYFIDENGKQVQ